MIPIQKLIEALDAHRGRRLRVRDGHPVEVERASGWRAISRQPLGKGAVENLLRPIAPPDAQASLGKGEVTFRHTAAQGDVEVTASWADGSGLAMVSRAGAGLSESAVPDRELLHTLLRLLADREGSDLHLRSGFAPVLRVHGRLERQTEPVVSAEGMAALLRAAMAPAQWTQFERDHDVDWAYELDGAGRFRCNAGYDRHGPFAVFRLIPARIQTIEDLNLPDSVRRFCDLGKGLVLVTGPTGSGKSTTLAALIDRVNATRTDHILTIEDPIEFVHPNKQCLITQREVGRHTMSFRQALRAGLREDPDVVLVGELRDLETVAIALETAETGHLVFGTLHTSTAASTLDRIVDQFPADRQAQIRVMLSESLRGVVSQVLCQRIGGGRVAAMEVLVTLPAIANLIREGKTFQIPSIMQTNRRAGMVTLNEALLDLVEGKAITAEEAYRRSVERSGLLQSLKAKGHDVGFAGAA